MKNYKEFLNENTYIQDLDKIKSTIRSCKTYQQTNSADNAYGLWKKKWKDEATSHDIQELDKIIQDKYKETNVE